MPHILRNVWHPFFDSMQLILRLEHFMKQLDAAPLQKVKYRTYTFIFMEDKMMGKSIYYYGERLFVSKEVAAVISKSNRKMRYQSVDIKQEHILVDIVSETVTVAPSKEDSLNRLLDSQRVEFPNGEESTEDYVTKKVMCGLLPDLIKQLTLPQQELLQMIFWDKFTEREIASALGISQIAVHGRKKRILRKLKKLLE